MDQIIISEGDAKDGALLAEDVATPATIHPRPKFFLIGENERSQSPKLGTRVIGTKFEKFVCINGNWQALRGRTISFEQIISFVLPGRNPQDDSNVTVTYRRGPHSRPNGLLQPRDVLPLVEGMLINASIPGAC